MDLTALDDAVAVREGRWQAKGLVYDVFRCSLTDKPAASLRATSSSATAELILWVSGEADLTWSPLLVAEPVTEHYDLTHQVGLQGCLDDLEGHLGISG